MTTVKPHHIRPGVIFSTPYESGCIARAIPTSDSYGAFLASDREGVTCEYVMDMVTEVTGVDPRAVVLTITPEESTSHVAISNVGTLIYRDNTPEGIRVTAHQSTGGTAGTYPVYWMTERAGHKADSDGTLVRYSREYYSEKEFSDAWAMVRGDFRTADGQLITQGLRVWTNELTVGTVDLSRLDDRGWFHVVIDGTGQRLSQNAERVATRFEGKPA